MRTLGETTPIREPTLIITRRAFTTMLSLTGLAALAGLSPLRLFTEAVAQSASDVAKPVSLPDMALGPDNAAVTITEFASMTCPHCAVFNEQVFPKIKAEYIDTGKVRYVLRAEFPIGKQSGVATIALRCASADKYFVLYDKFMRQQAAWVSQEVRPEAVLGVAAQVGMTRAQFDSCRENRGMIGKINAIKERGRMLGIVGTPNFFVDGTLVKSVIGIEEIRKMVDPILVGRVALDATTKAR